MLKKGIFTISVDFEFAWGVADKEINQEARKRIKKEVHITERLLELFDKYKISATWAIVSHLLENDCAWLDSQAHSNFPRPFYKDEKKDWFWQHPQKNEEKNALWFDTHQLIRRINEKKVRHEIGSHSYSHLIYGDFNVNPDSVKFDIEEAKRIHEKNNLDFNSFVFPRNKEAFHDLIFQNGIKSYRGNSGRWYSFLPDGVQRIFNLLDYYIPFSRVFLPEMHKSGLLNIKDSMLFLARNGLRKIILPFIMEAKAELGIKKAQKQKKIFHFWFHPSNFSYDTETQFRIFENILKYASDLRDKDLIDICTINQIHELNK